MFGVDAEVGGGKGHRYPSELCTNGLSGLRKGTWIPGLSSSRSVVEICLIGRVGLGRLECLGV